MRIFYDAVTKMRNASVTNSVIYLGLHIITSIVTLNTVGSIARNFGVRASGSGAGIIIGSIVGMAVSLGVLMWLFRFFLDPLEGVESAYKYFSELTYEKKARFGQNFSGRLKFLYVWSIIAISGLGVSLLFLLIALITLVSSGALRYLNGALVWGSLIVPVIQMIISVVYIPICAKVINAYKGLRPSFGAVTISDSYMFNGTNSGNNETVKTASVRRCEKCDAPYDHDDRKSCPFCGFHPKY
jgi:hypothetical protein